MNWLDGAIGKTFRPQLVGYEASGSKPGFCINVSGPLSYLIISLYTVYQIVAYS